MFEHKNLVESLVDHLRVLIISGELPGGLRLNEIDLSMKLNVSRPPLREAFQILEQQRLIQSMPRKGRFVPLLTKDNCKLIWQCREMMECYAITLLEKRAIRSVPSIMTNLEKTASYLDISDDRIERMAFLSDINQFHQFLIAAAENELLSHFYSLIKDNIYRYLYIDMFETKMPLVRYEDHKKIYNFIESGLYEQARQALAKHICKVEHKLLEIIK